MQTLPVAPKNIKAFYCTLDGASAVLTQVAGQILIMRYADGALIDYAPEMAPRLVVLGECGVAETQALADRRHGGPAWIATHRLMEVA